MVEEAVKESAQETYKETIFPPEPKWMERWVWSLSWFTWETITFKAFEIENELVI